MRSDVELLAVSPHTSKPQEHPLLDFLTQTENEHFGQLKQNIQAIHTKTDLVTSIQSLLSPLPITIQSPERLQYIQSQIQVLLQDDDVVNAVLQLIAFIQASSNTTFSEFIQTLKIKTIDATGQETYPNLEKFGVYNLIQRLLYPCLHGDHRLIFKTLQTSGYTPRMILPPQFSPYDGIISNIKGDPLSNLSTQTWVYGVTFAPTAMGNIAAAQLIAVPAFYRLLIALAALDFGGFLRFFCTRQTGLGRGRETALCLFFLSTLGLIGTFLTVELTDLSQVTAFSPPYIALFLCNMISGFGSAIFTVCTSDTAQTASNDNKTQRSERLKLLGITPSAFDDALAFFSRGTPGANIGKMGGLGSLTPAIALLIAAYSGPKIGNSGIYGLFSAITILGLIGSYFTMHPPIRDQLRPHISDDDIADDIARQMGQPQILSTRKITYLQTLRNLSWQKRWAIGRSSLNYSGGLGLSLADVATAGVILTNRGMSPQDAIPLTAAFSGFSALTRSLVGFFPRCGPPVMLTNTAIGIMAIASFLFAHQQDRAIWLPSFFVISFTSGVISFSSFNEIAQELPTHMGLATGLAGGFGAVSASFFSLAFAFLSTTNQTDSSGHTRTANEYYLATAFLGLCFLMNIVYQSKQHSNAQRSTSHTTVDVEQPRRKPLVGECYRFYPTIITHERASFVQSHAEIENLAADERSDTAVDYQM